MHQAQAVEAGAGLQPAQGMQSQCWRAPSWGWHPGTSGSTCSVVRRSYAVFTSVAKCTKVKRRVGRMGTFVVTLDMHSCPDSHREGGLW